MPFCPIYGTSVVGIYLLLGTPLKGRLASLFKKLPGKIRYIPAVLIYFVAAVIIPSLFELASEWFFQTVFHIRLWSYAGYPHNFHGYICLEFSLLWGGLITLAMATVWHGLHWLIRKIPNRALFWISTLFRVLMTVDFLFNFSFLLITGKHFSLQKLASGLGKMFAKQRSLFPL